MLNSKDRGKCRNSSGKRFRIERPPIKSWQFPANFEGNPFFPSLVYDAWQFNRGWDALHFCFTNPNYPRIIFSLSFSLSNCREFERNSKHFLSSTCHVRNGERSGIRKFRKLRKLREFSRIIDRIEKFVFIFVKEGWEDWIKKKSMLWYLVIVA